MKEIDYERTEYVTNREVQNDEGEMTGRVKMFSYDNEMFHYQIKCPYCEHDFEGGSQELGSRPWWIECPECERFYKRQQDQRCSQKRRLRTEVLTESMTRT